MYAVKYTSFMNKMKTNTALDLINGPVRVIFEPTINCNLKCPMCDRTHKTEYEKHKKYQLSTNEILAFINDAINMGATNFQIIGGGEPMMHPDILYFIETIKKRGVNLHLWTNGTLITEKNAELLSSNCDIITVSLDSPHEEINDKLRGMPGATIRTVTGLRLLRRANPNAYLRIHSVLSAYNIAHLKDFLPLIDEIHINEVGGAKINPFSFVPSDFLISDCDQPKYDAIIDDFCEELKQREVNLAGCYASISKKMIDDIESAMGVKDNCGSHITCLGLWSQVTVRPNGDVSICCFSYKPVLGNLHEMSFYDIWNSHKAESLREEVYRGVYLDSPCKGCDLGSPVFSRLLESGEDMARFYHMINTSR